MMATQNIEDMTGNDAARNVLVNSDTVMFLRQSEVTAKSLLEHFVLSDEEIQLLLSLNKGQALIKYGNDGSNAGSTDAVELIGRCREFDGSDQINMGNDSSLDMTTGITLSALIKGDDGMVIAKDNVAGIRPYGLRILGGLARFGIELTTGFVIISGTINLPNTEFSHVVATYDGAMMRLQVNGEIDFDVIQTGEMVSHTTSLAIGARASGTTDYTGLIDEARVSSIGRSIEWNKIEADNLLHNDEFWHRVPLLTYGEPNYLTDGQGNRIKVKI